MSVEEPDEVREARALMRQTNTRALGVGAGLALLFVLVSLALQGVGLETDISVISA